MSRTDGGAVVGRRWPLRGVGLRLDCVVFGLMFGVGLIIIIIIIIIPLNNMTSDN